MWRDEGRKKPIQTVLFTCSSRRIRTFPRLEIASVQLLSNVFYVLVKLTSHLFKNQSVLFTGFGVKIPTLVSHFSTNSYVLCSAQSEYCFHGTFSRHILAVDRRKASIWYAGQVRKSHHRTTKKSNDPSDLVPELKKKHFFLSIYRDTDIAFNFSSESSIQRECRSQKINKISFLLKENCLEQATSQL